MQLCTLQKTDIKMKHIGKYNITKVDGSITYTELDIYKGEVSNGLVWLRTVETSRHNGGETIRTTEKQYPDTMLAAFTGNYNPITDEPEIDLTILGSILLNFGITLH